MKHSQALIALFAAAGIACVADATVVVYTVSATGTQEVPVADPDGTAIGTVTVDDVANTVSWNLNWANIGTPGLMHIHTGAAGVNGGILVDMGIATTGGAGTLINSKVVPHSSIVSIMANPSGYYVNIHNSPFPAGAVRGQLTVQAPPCPADLNGDHQVDGADLGQLLGAWGTNNAAADLNHDGTVDGADLGQLLGAWGSCPV